MALEELWRFRMPNLISRREVLATLRRIRSVPAAGRGRFHHGRAGRARGHRALQDI